MGGKSRKTGGISKALIDKIKAGGNLPATKTTESKAPVTPPAPKSKHGFDLGEDA